MAKLLITVLLGLISVFVSSATWSDIGPVKDPLPAANPVRALPGLKTYRNGRITGGQPASPNQFPYQVGLLLTKPAANATAFCGGCLISDQWVLTAAHCTDDVSRAEVRLGALWIFEKDAEQQVVLFVDQENFRVHEQWDRSKLRNDIALLKLPTPVQFSERIQPIALPRQSDPLASFENRTVVASGWGKDSDEATKISPVLRFVESVTIEQRICKSAYFFSPPAESAICMNATAGKSTCNGDSGGPLAGYESDGRPILLGATSYGLSLGCEVGWPVVFTRIASYLSWINEKTGIPLR